jgi:alpha-D-xyloside xylohydrolase
MVSIWPTVDKKSPLYPTMLEQGLLIHQDRGIPLAMTFQGDCIHADFTNPSARHFVWDQCKKNYFDKGIELFWLDEAEPEYTSYDFDLYRYHIGSVLSIGNHYPVDYARAFYDGQTKAGQMNVVNLVRCAWAGSQRYGALIWSGDIASSWSSFRNQLAAGLNMGMAGIPWWTTDIGGFHGGDPKDPQFRELLVRWFQWGCFCPVMRLHGDREPRQPQHGRGGGSTCRSGAENEVWSFGEDNYPILVKYMRLRERLREYIRGLMMEAHEKGMPVMRTMFFEFPDDEQAWSNKVENQYMFGKKYLCAPIMEAGMKKRNVYLPKGAGWKALEVGLDRDREGEEIQGGQTVEVELVIGDMPVFVRQ